MWRTPYLWNTTAGSPLRTYAKRQLLYSGQSSPDAHRIQSVPVARVTGSGNPSDFPVRETVGQGGLQAINEIDEAIAYQLRQESFRRSTRYSMWIHTALRVYGPAMYFFDRPAHTNDPRPGGKQP